MRAARVSRRVVAGPGAPWETGPMSEPPIDFESEPPPSRIRTSLRVAARSPKAQAVGWGAVLFALVEIAQALAPVLTGGALPPPFGQPCPEAAAAP